MEPKKDQLQKLDPTTQKNKLTVFSEESLRILAQQVHLTVLNSKVKQSDELLDEIKRRFSSYPPEATLWVWTTVRDDIGTFPSIHELRNLYRDWQRGQREQQELRERLNQKWALEQGRKQGLVASVGEVLKQLADTVKKMPEPEHAKRRRYLEERSRLRSSGVPLIGLHMSPEQIAARREKERAEIERYIKQDEEKK